MSLNITPHMNGCAGGRIASIQDDEINEKWSFENEIFMFAHPGNLVGISKSLNYTSLKKTGLTV